MAKIFKIQPSTKSHTSEVIISNANIGLSNLRNFCKRKIVGFRWHIVKGLMAKN